MACCNWLSGWPTRFCCVVVTPGPGSYILPSDFGYLENKNSPRNNISTQSSCRPRVISRLQLSTMTGNVSHNLGEISVNGTEREPMLGGTTVKSQNVKKRNQMNSTFMRMKTGDDLTAEDSLDQTNQLTTREWTTRMVHWRGGVSGRKTGRAFLPQRLGGRGLRDNWLLISIKSKKIYLRSYIKRQRTSSLPTATGSTSVSDWGRGFLSASLGSSFEWLTLKFFLGRALPEIFGGANHLQNDWGRPGPWRATTGTALVRCEWELSPEREQGEQLSARRSIKGRWMIVWWWHLQKAAVKWQIASSCPRLILS